MDVHDPTNHFKTHSQVFARPAIEAARAESPGGCGRWECCSVWEFWKALSTQTDLRAWRAPRQPGSTQTGKGNHAWAQKSRDFPANKKQKPPIAEFQWPRGGERPNPSLNKDLGELKGLLSPRQGWDFYGCPAAFLLLGKLMAKGGRGTPREGISGQGIPVRAGPVLVTALEGGRVMMFSWGQVKWNPKEQSLCTKLNFAPCGSSNWDHPRPSFLLKPSKSMPKGKTGKNIAVWGNKMQPKQCQRNKGNKKKPNRRMYSMFMTRAGKLSKL